MLALYRSGRQTEALDVYQRAHRRLDEAFGVQPGPALQALQREVLEQAPSLIRSEPVAVAGEAEPLRPLHRDGRRRVAVRRPRGGARAL